MRGRGAFAAAVAALLLIPATATAAPPPGAAISDNLDYVTRVAGAAGITEGKFDKVRGKKVLVVTGRFGFKTYDVSNPENPVFLDDFLPAGIAPPEPGATLPRQPLGGYWQDEDMELDTKRKLIIGALDPRHNTTGPSDGACPHDDGLAVRDVDCKSGFYVISYADPRNLRQVGDFVSLPSGHTASCIHDCKYIWTGGPARRADQDWLNTTILPAAGPITLQNRLIGDGRPIWVTDLRDAANPKVSDEPVDLYRNDQYTDYSHDVDEDARGIAWVAGRAESAATPRRASIATRTRTAGARRRRSIRSLWPAAASSGTSRRRGAETTAWRRPPTSCTTPAGRPTARSGRRA